MALTASVVHGLSGLLSTSISTKAEELHEGLKERQKKPSPVSEGFYVDRWTEFFFSPFFIVNKQQIPR